MPPPARDRFMTSTTRDPAKVCCKMTFSSDEAYESHLLNSANHFACKHCLADHRTAEGLKRHMNQMHAAEQRLGCIGCKRTFNRAGALVGHIQLEECTYLKSGYIEDLKANDPRASGMYDLIKQVSSWRGSEYRKEDGQHQLVDTSTTVSQTISQDASSLDSSVQERTATVGEEGDLISFDTDTAASMIMNAPWEQPAVKFNQDVDFPALAPVSNNTVNNTNKGSGSSPQSSGNVAKAMFGKSTALNHKQQYAVIHIPKGLNDSASRLPDTSDVFSSSTPARSPTSVNTHAPPTPAWGRISSSHPGIVPAPAACACDHAVSKPSTAATPAPTWGNASSQVPTSTALFPNAPAAIAPSAELMESLAIDNAPPEPMYDEHNPKNPNFNAERYYNNFSLGYKCPHFRVCKGKGGDKKSVQAFIQHLLSPIHQDHEKVTCQRCLRVYINATAFVQHFESQSYRCDARTLGNAGAVVREIAQVVTTEGERHEDETVKYINTPGLVLNVQDTITGMGAASRRAAHAQAERNVKFWEDPENKPAW